MARNKLSIPEISARREISKNLKHYARGLTQRQLADKTGIPASTLSGYFAMRSTPNAGMLEKIADALGVQKSDIDPRYQTAVSSSIAKTNDDHSIGERNESIHYYPYLDAGVSCGAPALVDSYTNNDLQRIQLSDAVMGQYAGDKDILVIHANGESMNHIFPSGALLAVKRTSNPSNGDIVVFSVDNEEFSCKRYYKNDNAKIVSFQPDSDDSSFEPYVYRYEDASNVTIFGKVVVYTVVL